MINLSSHWSYAISKLDIIESSKKEDEMLANISIIDKPIVLGFLNAHGFNMLLDTPSFFESIKCMDIILRDGKGLDILLRMLGKEPGNNMNGTDFIPELLKKHKGKRIAIFATEDSYLNKAKKTLAENMSIDVVVADNGFNSDEYYLSQLENTSVDIILLGMGMPKQERIACMLKRELNYPTVIICGGAIVDFLAGRFSRAPRWMRRIGMEWLYRFILEPRRLFKRYVYGNILFIFRAVIHKAKQ